VNGELGRKPGGSTQSVHRSNASEEQLGAAAAAAAQAARAAAGSPARGSLEMQTQQQQQQQELESHEEEDAEALLLHAAVRVVDAEVRRGVFVCLQQCETHCLCACSSIQCRQHTGVGWSADAAAWWVQALLSGWWCLGVLLYTTVQLAAASIVWQCRQRACAFLLMYRLATAISTV
jgi:hypothetical protein